MFMKCTYCIITSHMALMHMYCCVMFDMHWLSMYNFEGNKNVLLVFHTYKCAQLLKYSNYRYIQIVYVLYLMYLTIPKCVVHICSVSLIAFRCQSLLVYSKGMLILNFVASINNIYNRAY